MRVVKLGNVFYEVADEMGNEICILVPTPFADGETKQLRIWMYKSDCVVYRLVEE